VEEWEFVSGGVGEFVSWSAKFGVGEFDGWISVTFRGRPQGKSFGLSYPHTSHITHIDTESLTSETYDARMNHL
jgi:hypothetical protein